MKKHFAATLLLFMSLFASAQLEKKDFILGLDVGFNNQAKSSIDNEPFWSATGGLPIGLNLQYLVSNRISVGWRFNYATIDATYSGGGFDQRQSLVGYSTGIYGVYHYVNKNQFSLGSGLSFGYREASASIGDVAVSSGAFKFDVVLVDAKYIFKEHFGAQLNLYLLDNYNNWGSAGLFWRF